MWGVNGTDTMIRCKLETMVCIFQCTLQICYLMFHIYLEMSYFSLHILYGCIQWFTSCQGNETEESCYFQNHCTVKFTEDLPLLC